MRIDRRRVLVMPGLPWAGGAARAGQPVPMRWVTSNLPPFAWMGPLGPQGFGCELLKAIATRLDTPCEIEFFPWVRAVRMAREQENCAVFPLTRTAERERQYRWLIPLAHLRYTFYARTGSGLDIESAQALRRVEVATLRGSAALGQLRERGFTRIVETQDYKDLVRHLAAGLVEVIYGGTVMINAAIDEFGHRPTDFRTGLVLEEADSFIAASPRADPLQCERWMRGFRELQQSGAFARLLKQYPSIR